MLPRDDGTALEEIVGDAGFRKGYDPRRHVQPAAAKPASAPVAPGTASGNAVRTAARPPIVARRADKDAPVNPGTDPKEAVRQALTIIQQRTPQLARRLLRLTEAIDREAAPCLTCGRGSKREDELLLKALQAALGIGGLAPGKVAPGSDGGGGPVLIFPAGTKMAVLAGAVDNGPRTMADVVDGDVVRITRADELPSHDGGGA